MFPTLKPRSSPSELLTGLTLPFRALKLIITTPKVLKLSLLGGLIATLVVVGLAPVLWALSQHLAHSLFGPADGAFGGFGIGLVGFVIFALLYAVSALTVPNLVLAPLQDPLSEAAEVACGQFTPPPFTMRAFGRGIAESLTHTVLRLTFMAIGFGVLLPLHLIPGAGSVLWLVFSTIWSMFWLALEHLSNPAARHLHPFREVVAALRARLPLALGFGASLWVLLWVPVVNFLLLPVAIVAGTLLFRSLLQAGLLAPGAGTKR